MGKGDKKSKRGKIIMGSYGVRRPQRKTAAIAAPAPEPVATKPAKKKSSPKAAKKEDKAVE